MRKFMITFTHVDGGWDRLTPAQRQKHQVDLKEFVRALAEEKKSELVFLRPPAEAKTIRLDADGRYEVEEGTVAKSPEYAGGYYLIEAESLEEAVEWAKRGRFMPGANEVREIFDYRP
jgi:hypothetical protein